MKFKLPKSIKVRKMPKIKVRKLPKEINFGIRRLNK